MFTSQETVRIEDEFVPVVSINPYRSGEKWALSTSPGSREFRDLGRSEQWRWVSPLGVFDARRPNPPCHSLRRRVFFPDRFSVLLKKVPRLLGFRSSLLVLCFPGG